MEELKTVSIRLVEDRPLLSNSPIRTSEDIALLVRDMLKGYDREAAVAINLDVNMRPINLSIISIGALDYAVVEPREFFKAAILSNARQVVLVHNHPSGSVEPSAPDIDISDRLVKCGQLLGIPVVDSIIVGSGYRYHSMLRESTLSFDYQPRLATRERDISWGQVPEELQTTYLYMECSSRKSTQDDHIGYFDPPSDLWMIPGLERYRLVEILEDGSTKPWPDNTTYFRNEREIADQFFENQEIRQNLSLIAYDKAMEMINERRMMAHGKTSPLDESGKEHIDQDLQQQAVRNNESELQKQQNQKSSRRM